MKEKVIKKILSEKKPVASIFLVVSSICLLVIPIFSIIMMTDSTFYENIDVIKEIFLLFGFIGCAGLGITFYLMKYTNKLNVVKIPKEELEILYDKCINEEAIKELEEISKQVEVDYEQAKKNSFINISISIIISALTAYLIFKFELLNFGGYLLGTICVVSIGAMLNQIEVSLKSMERLIEEFKEKAIIEALQNEIYDKNKQAIKESKQIEKENKEKEIKRKNPILFWLIESILLIWCLAAFSSDVLSMIQTDGLYGFIGIVITFGIPAFFFVRNIYVRYFKKDK